MNVPTVSRSLARGSFRVGEVVLIVLPHGNGEIDPSLVESVGATIVRLGIDDRVLGWSGSLAELVDRVAPADIVVAESDVTVPPGWVATLKSAAHERTDIATVVPLHGSSATIATSRPGHPHPIVAPGAASVVYLTRRALNVVGFGGSLDRFGECAASAGFVNTLADELTVNATRECHDLTALGFQNLPDPLRASPGQPGRTRRGTRSPVIAIDAELINTALTGTYEVSFAMSLALARRPDVAAVYWVAPAGRVQALKEMLAGREAGITVTTLEELVAAGIRVDVAFRPYQDFLGRTWPRLSEYGDRNIIWTLDLIVNTAPTYARSEAEYRRLNRANAQAWDNADAIGVLSPHVGETLEAFRGGPPEPRLFVLPVGAPEGDFGDPGGDFDDEALRRLEDRQFVLLLGNNYAHKGRAWFIRMAQGVVKRGWPGAFVLAGPSPEFGSSTSEEHAEIERAGTAATSFIITGRVSADDRARLMSRAAVTACPSVTEGWGMTPSEALAFGSVPLASRGGGLRDVGPADGLAFDMVDDDVDADMLYRVLTDEALQASQKAAWQRSVEAQNWEGAAAILVDRVLAVGGLPRRFAALLAADDIAIEPVRALRWRLLSRVLPEGNRARSALGRVVRGARRAV